MSSCWGSLQAGELRESQSDLGVLKDLRASKGFVWLDDGLDNMDWLSSGTMSTCHLVVHLRNSSAEGVASVLLVHVNDTGSWKILEDNTVVSNSLGLALENLTNWNNLSLALSDLVLTFHFIPELGSSDHSVLSENSNPVANGIGSINSAGFSTDNPVLSHLQWLKQLIKNRFYPIYTKCGPKAIHLIHMRFIISQVALTVFYIELMPTPLTILVVENKYR